MTAFDYAFLGVLTLSTLLGVWRGLVSEVFALAGWVAAVLAAWQFAGLLAAYLVPLISVVWLRWVAAFMVIFVVVLLVLGVVRFLVRELLSVAGMSPLDRLFGAFFGMLRAVLLALLVVAAAGLTTIPREPWWRESLFAPALETAVVAAKPWLPKELAGRIRYR